MVFQQGALFEWMSVRENVAFGPRMKGVPPKVDERSIICWMSSASGFQGQGDLRAVRRHAAARGAGPLPGQRTRT